MKAPRRREKWSRTSRPRPQAQSAMGGHVVGDAVAETTPGGAGCRRGGAGSAGWRSPRGRRPGNAPQEGFGAQHVQAVADAEAAAGGGEVSTTSARLPSRQQLPGWGPTSAGPPTSQVWSWAPPARKAGEGGEQGRGVVSPSTTAAGRWRRPGGQVWWTGRLLMSEITMAAASSDHRHGVGDGNHRRATDQGEPGEDAGAGADARSRCPGACPSIAAGNWPYRRCSGGRRTPAGSSPPPADRWPGCRRPRCRRPCPSVPD